MFTAVTMINPITSWFEIVQIPVSQEYKNPKKKEPEMCMNMMLAQLSQSFYNNQLSCYPRPTYIIYDNNSGFKLHFKILCEHYGLKCKPMTKKNPQTNSILERIHQVAMNMLRSYNLDNQDLDAIDTFGGYLANIAWGE